jgi:hypothetical protein
MLPELKFASAVLTAIRRETGSAGGKDCGMHKVRAWLRIDAG